MAAYPELGVADLADFTGRAEASYPTPYTSQALLQATLLWRLSSRLVGFPEDSEHAKLVRFAILQMADSFVLGQQYQQIAASPFSSETIGSYSYSKALKSMAAGAPTGVYWFDLAMQLLGVSTAAVTSGSYELFEHELVYAVDGSGGRHILGPAEIRPIDDVPLFVSRPVAYDPNRS